MYAEKADKLYKNCKLVGIGGADHCFIGQEDELAAVVKEFFM
jgi:hypothetical protein